MSSMLPAIKRELTMVLDGRGGNRPSLLGIVLQQSLYAHISAERLIWSTLEADVKNEGRKLTLVTDAGQRWKGSLIFTVSSFIPTVKKWLRKSAWSCRKKRRQILKAPVLSINSVTVWILLYLEHFIGQLKSDWNNEPSPFQISNYCKILQI